jgi:hypothetical protein
MTAVLGKELKLLFSSSLVAELIDKVNSGHRANEAWGPVQQPYALS